MQEWREVVGFESFYRIYPDGRVFSLGRAIRGSRRGTVCVIRYKAKFLTPQNNGAGRQRFRVQLRGREGTKPLEVYICDLVSAAFGKHAVKALPAAYQKVEARS